jgi:hypothetical protein
MTTNINATEQEILTGAEVLKMAAILDDRAPAADPARIAAWAEKIHQHGLERNDLLDGLQAYYDRPSERAIQIGDLIHFARIVKRDRLDREADATRDSRRERHDGKAATDEMPALAAGVAQGAVKPTARLVTAETALQCATTKAEAQAAIAEFLAAKADARGGTTEKNRRAA